MPFSNRIKFAGGIHARQRAEAKAAEEAKARADAARSTARAKQMAELRAKRKPAGTKSVAKLVAPVLAKPGVRHIPTRAFELIAPSGNRITDGGLEYAVKIIRH